MTNLSVNYFYNHTAPIPVSTLYVGELFVIPEENPIRIWVVLANPNKSRRKSLSERVTAIPLGLTASTRGFRPGYLVNTVYVQD
jgi:hypothetical protein